DNHVLVTSDDVDSLTVDINPGQTLSVVVAPAGLTLQPVITVLDTTNHVIATATAPADGQAAVIETLPISVRGVYTIQVSDAGGNLGLYTIQATLNAFVKTGIANDTIGGAQDLNPGSISLGSGVATQLGAVGTLLGGPAAGDAYVVARYASGGPQIL